MPEWLDFFSESFEFDAAGVLYSTDTDNVYRLEGGLRTPLISGGATVQGRLILSGTAGGVAYQADFVRDKLGRITQKTEIVEGVGTQWGYGYDPAGRLETVTRDGAAYAAYSYDDNGNRLSKTQDAQSTGARHDDQDRLLAYGANTYSYTANGELLSKTGPEGTTGYTYDVLGNLMKVELPDGTVIEYLIDGQNRRIGKKLNGVLVQGSLVQGSAQPRGRAGRAG